MIGKLIFAQDGDNNNINQWTIKIKLTKVVMAIMETALIELCQVNLNSQVIWWDLKKEKVNWGKFSTIIKLIINIIIIINQLTIIKLLPKPGKVIFMSQTYRKSIFTFFYIKLTVYLFLSNLKNHLSINLSCQFFNFLVTLTLLEDHLVSSIPLSSSHSLGSRLISSSPFISSLLLLSTIKLDNLKRKVISSSPESK